MKKEFLTHLGFILKDNSVGVYFKKYRDNSIIEVDFEKEEINYLNIECESKTTSNFSQAENFVVLECVNRLLEKGYKAEDIILEKTYKLGRQNSGRLDILVKKDGKTFLMIECKTYGKEFDKELKNISKDGGQIFSYFQQDRDAEFIMLYASLFNGKEIDYKNEIIKIEESYRETSNVADFYDRWNKFTKQNGIFDNWVLAYNFESKALTLNDLKDIKEEDSSFIFHSFLKILRNHVISDESNAFNKIFALFLCKIIDEDRSENEELHFQWVEGKDTHEIFQKRLLDLYKKGMKFLLNKDITDTTDDDILKKYSSIGQDNINKILDVFINLRLKRSNEFSFKEVFDEDSFLENAKVVKEIVVLLQSYKIRYTKKQPFLGDFFELLLTTGLKQKAGQFFTPVPIARFICKSLPIKNIIEDKLNNGDSNNLLPFLIDYSAGSGHFLTEGMEEIQQIINKIDDKNLKQALQKKIQTWKINEYEWAKDYIYGIEKDYRLVKTAKVSCYLHGDGLAHVIHGDGLDSFEFSKTYEGKLKEFQKDDKSENNQFDLVISNPPYSVGYFKNTLSRERASKDFDLFQSLTDNSSEIEALFIERTKQLLKEGGIAAIILPSSILSNTGIYTKAREIILKNFEIISIVTLGSNTFMATGTNTVILFMRKRNKFISNNLEKQIDDLYKNLLDVSLNNLENIFSKYVNYVWEGLIFEDYKTLVLKNPNEKVLNHEIFKEYSKKLKLDKKQDLFDEIIKIEKDKMLYFVLSYSQNVVLVKSGEKQAEKEFLGYEFSFRKGSEGIHPIQGGKLIDECTKLFDPESLDNPEKVSTYIYDGFNGDFSREVSENLQEHIFRTRLVDLLTFDRVDFEKNISTNIKKKVSIESKWEIKKLGEVVKIVRGVTYGKNDQVNNITERSILTADNITLEGKLEINKQIYLKEDFNYDFEKNLRRDDIFICFSSGSIKHLGKLAYITENTNYFAGGFMGILRNSNNNIYNKFLYNLLNTDFYRNYVMSLGSGSNINNLSSIFNEVKIPLPLLDIQQKIVDEIEVLEKEEQDKKGKVEVLKGEIKKIVGGIEGETVKIEEIQKDIINGKTPLKSEGKYWNSKDINWFTTPDYNDNIYINSTKQFISKEGLNIVKIVPKNSVLISCTATIGKIGINNIELTTNQQINSIVCNDKIIPLFLAYYLKINNSVFQGLTDNSGVQHINLPTLKNIKIPLPPIETQKQIVSQIEKIESEIEILENDLKTIPEKKKEVLRNYL